MFGIIFLIFWCAVVLFMLWKYLGHLKQRKIVKNMVKNGINNESVRELINAINKMGGFINQPTFWDTARANFELVNQSDNVSTELKKELRLILLSKGVNRLQEVKDFEKKSS